MNWRLLIENVVREKREEEKDNGKRNHGQQEIMVVTYDDSEAKKIITKCNLTIV